MGNIDIKMNRPSLINQLYKNDEPIKRLTVRLSPQLHEELKIHCAKMRISIQDYVKNMIEDSLK